MNRRYIAAVMVMGLCVGVTPLHSEPESSSASVIAALQALKAANQDVIQRQEKTIKTLEELFGQTQQLKIMAKRKTS